MAKAKSKIKIELLKDVDFNEVAANLEYSIIIIGKEGNSLTNNFLIIFYIKIIFRLRSREKNIIKLSK